MKERKPNRLEDYDYSQKGYYFVTVCTKDRREWFWNIEKDEMVLNQYGKIADDFWKEMSVHFDGIVIDEFKIMPNPIHGIVIIRNDFTSPVGNAYMRSLRVHDRTKMLLSKAVQQYKASVTRKINSFQEFSYFEWQKSFYDHIIRNEGSLDRIRQYIFYNPLKWELDIENKNNHSRHKNSADYYDEIITGVEKIQEAGEANT
jgi:REP element-mobilizing transposase RayT